MTIINNLADNSTISFVSKKAQMYTMFCFAFKALDNKIEINQEVFEKFKLFISAYNDFKNEYIFDFQDSSVREVYEGIKRYKLASSEGINKLGNRVIRLEVMWKFLIKSKPEIKQVFKRISEEIQNLKVCFDDKFEKLED